jgi:hypothetical protein
LFCQALLKDINKLDGQKATCSANLDGSDVQPSLRNWSRYTFM